MIVIKPQKTRIGRNPLPVRGENRASPILIDTDYKKDKNDVEGGIQGILYFVRQGHSTPVHIEHNLPFILLSKGKEDDEIMVDIECHDGLNIHNIKDFAVILEALLRRDFIVTLDLGTARRISLLSDRKAELLQFAGSLSCGHLNGMLLDEIVKIRVDAVHKFEIKNEINKERNATAELKFEQLVRESIKSTRINEPEYLNRHVYVRFENCQGAYKP